MDEAPRREILLSKDVAAMFGKTPEWWTIERETYIRTRNFPRPLPGGRRRMWSRRMVERWFETGGQSHFPDQAIGSSDAAFSRRLEDFEDKKRGERR